METPGFPRIKAEARGAEKGEQAGEHPIKEADGRNKKEEEAGGGY
jgi:hypothetical protein